MKKLYREDESYTDDAIELGIEIRALVTPVINKWVAKGYSYREVCDLSKNYIDTIRSVCIIEKYSCKENT